jgi:hypothetical protein
MAPRMIVMTRENTEILLNATGKTLADCLGECEVETGRKLGVDYVVSGRITRVGAVIITMRLFAMPDGRLLSTAEAKGQNAEQLRGSIDGALAKLYLPIGSSESAATVQARPVRLPDGPSPVHASAGVLPGTIDVAGGSTLGEDMTGALITVDAHPWGRTSTSPPGSA